MSAEMDSIRRTRKYTRGSSVALMPHRDSTSVPDELSLLCKRVRIENPDVLLAADLFSGAGGLSLGLTQAGIEVVLAVDHDRYALETHEHHFPGMSLDWDLSDADKVEELAALMRDNSIDVLAGGPPCQPFSKAGRPGIKHLVRTGAREPHDQRRDLWRSFLEVAKLSRPKAILMENVPDMALDREMFILRSMVLELEEMGYATYARVVEGWRYGVPQVRKRLILVAVSERRAFQWPAEAQRKVTVGNAISDLPPVEGGWQPLGSDEGWDLYGAPKTSFQKEMRKGVPQADANKIFDHVTRPVRDDDREAFELLDSDSRYSDLPAHLKRYRDDIFDDKYKRLADDDVSRTITAHLAKDGYGYIHPEQNRTLTIREAARLQTFPDWFRFAGPPSAAFRQIGNAVPPMLGAALGRALIKAVQADKSSWPSTEDVSRVLASYFRESHATSVPWLHAESNWQAITGVLALDRTRPLVANALWPLIEKMKAPSDLLQSVRELKEMLTWIGREERLHDIIRLAEASPKADLSDAEIEDLLSKGIITQAIADLAELKKSTGDEPVIVTSGNLRVLARFRGDTTELRNRNTDGRLGIASLIGYSTQARAAQLALLEIAADVCTPQEPKCAECPLNRWCLSAPVFLAAKGLENELTLDVDL